MSQNIINLSIPAPSMGGEDFAYFCKEVPSVYFFVGISEDMSKPAIHDNPYFKWNDKNVMTISESFSQIVVDYLNKL